MANIHEERRRFSRIPFRAEVTLFQGQQRWTCQMLDLSLKGALLEKPNGCELITGEVALITLGLDDGCVIEMHVDLVHQENSHLGFSCRTIDLDSLSHLRRLIELNLGDSEAADREIEELTSS